MSRDYDEAEAEARIAEVKLDLTTAIYQYSPDAYVDDRISNDLHYEGPITPLLEFFQTWRSEIEELGA